MIINKRGRILKLLVLSLFLLSISLTMVSSVWYNPLTWFSNKDAPEGLGTLSNLGTISMQSKGKAWTIVNTNEKVELKQDGKEVCLLYKDAKSLNDIPETKNIYNDQGQLIKSESRTSTSLSAKQKYGYCYTLNKEEYLKFGEHSTIIVYQDQNYINYQLDFADVNVTLSCEDVAQNDIFIYENQDNYKFGANGTFEGLKNCTYVIESSVDIEDNVWSPYIVNPEKFDNGSIIYDEVHSFDFTDVCFKFYNGTSANCEFNWTGNNRLEVSFISDKDIDPNIKAEAKYERNGNELVDKETYVQDVFDLGNGQTNYKIHVGQINYKKYGGFTSINTTLTWNENERVWEINKASYYGKIPEYADELIVFYNAYEGSNSFISAYPVASRVQGILQDDKKSVLYEDAFGTGIDLKVYAELSGLKKVIIINEKPLDTSQNISFDFELNIPFDTQIKDKEGNIWDKEVKLNFKDKTLLIGENGTESYFTNAFLWDSNTLAEPVDIELYVYNERIYLRKKITSDVLEKAIYPLYTDHPTSYYADSGDSIAYVSGAANWNTAHDATTADGVNSGFIFPNSEMNYQTETNIYRAYIPIDTSGIGAGSTVTAASLFMYVTTAASDDHDGKDFVCIVSAFDVASDNELAVGDFNVIGDAVDNPTEAHDSEYRMDLTTTSDDQYIEWVFNSNALSWVNVEGYTKLGAREGHDATDTAIGSNDNFYALFSVSGEANAPYLDVTVSAGDTEYPIFSNYWDDNASLVGSGTGNFNVTVLNTNGTVWLEIDGNNITATNSSGNVTTFNATASLSSAGDYVYRWHSWGNGTSHNYNMSGNRTYTVNAAPKINLDLTYPTTNVSVTQNQFFNVTVNVSCGNADCGLIKVSLDPEQKTTAKRISEKWTITKTGAEENLDVTYNEINNTQTEFCVGFLNKDYYINSGSLSGKDKSTVPITKVKGTSQIEKQSINLNSLKSNEKTCFKINHPVDISEESFKIGWNSVEIDSSSVDIATAYSYSENICQDLNGNLHVVWEDGASDLWYANSSDDGANWDTKEILAGTVDHVGIMCKPNNNLTVYFRDDGDVKGLDSTNGGVSFGSTYNIESDIDANLEYVSCVPDSFNNFHCVMVDNADAAYYVNSTDLESAETVTTNNDVMSCDIAVDETNDIYIACLDDNLDGVNIWSNTLNGWGDNNNVTFYNGILAMTPTDGYTLDFTILRKHIYMAIVDQADLQFCNSSVDNLNGASCKEIDSDSSYHPTIGVNENGAIVIIYMEDDGGGTGYLYKANSSDYGINWNIRSVIYQNGRYPSIQDSLFGHSNRMTDTVNYVSVDTGLDINFDSFSVTYSERAKYGLVSNSTGNKPFYTNGSNPYYVNLSKDESQEIVFWVNATGGTGVNHTFFVYANTTTNESISNITGKWNVTIITGLVDTSFTVSFPEGTDSPIFNGSSKTETGLAPLNQTDSVPILNISNSGDVSLNISLLVNQTGTFKFYADDDNSIIGAKELTTSIVEIVNSLSSSDSQGIWMWVNYTNELPQTTNRKLNVSVLET